MMPSDETLSLADTARELVKRTAAFNKTPAEWVNRFGNVLDPSKPAQLHLAVFVEPFLSWIVDGTKTVESRFSAVRCAPWNVVGENDVVLAKMSSGPVVGAFSISSVTSYMIADGDLDLIRELFGDAIRAETDDFWDTRQRAKYATLMGIEAYHPIEPTQVPKRDRRGWVVLDTHPAQGTLLP